MLPPLRIPNELDLADPVVAVCAQDRAAALDDLGHLLADHQTAGTESFGLLLELAADERAAHLAVRSDVRAERIDPTGWNVDDLLRHAREIGGLAGEADQLLCVLCAKDLHAEAVKEAPLLRWLDDRGIADLLGGRPPILQRGRARVGGPGGGRVPRKAPLVQDRLHPGEPA